MDKVLLHVIFESFYLRSISTIVCKLNIIYIINVMKKILITAILRDMEDLVTSHILKNYNRLKKYCQENNYETIFVIYENNSIDNTKDALAQIAKNDSTIHIYREDFNENDKFHSRDIYNKPHKYEKIAFAWNRISNIIRSTTYNDCSIVIMIDLSLNSEWPIEGILTHIQKVESTETDIALANVINRDGTIMNPITYRDNTYRVGPEIVGIQYFIEDYVELKEKILNSDHKELPVISYYGGLLIMNRILINDMRFSAFPTSSLEKYYQYNMEDIIHQYRNVDAPTYINGIYAFGSTNVEEIGLFYYFTYNTNSPIIHPIINFLIHLYVLKKKTILYPNFVWKNYEDSMLIL